MPRTKHRGKTFLRAYWCLGLVLLGIKRLFMFLFSHVGLTGCVFGYCILGGWIFRGLEGNHERDVRKEAEKMREKYILKIQNISESKDDQNDYDFENITYTLVKEFEEEIIYFTKSTRWNGLDGEGELQWSFAGSLLFSVTVITTIGYGQLAPRTKWGRIATIIYAIFGIPLTFLCLSIIGSSLASIFKFIYKNLFYAFYRKWLRLRTYVDSVESLNYHSTVAAAEAVPVTIAAAAAAVAQIDHNNDYDKTDSKIVLLDTHEPFNVDQISQNTTREEKPMMDCNAEGLCNEYTETDNEISNRDFSVNKQNENDKTEKKFLRRSDSYLLSVLDDDGVSEREICKYGDEISLVALPIQHQDFSNKDLVDIGEMETAPQPWKVIFSRKNERKKEMRSKDEVHTESSENHEHIRIPVLVSLLVFGAYICLGAFLFSFWEQEWDYLIGSYFCFITLSTIGLGDFVPGSSGKSWASEEKQAICSLYLLFGMAMTVMCLKLMQEEIRHQFSNLGHKIGILENDDETDS